jgi:hypothetical protein
VSIATATRTEEDRTSVLVSFRLCFVSAMSRFRMKPSAMLLQQLLLVAIVAMMSGVQAKATPAQEGQQRKRGQM